MSEVLKQLENSVDEKLTVAEVYANRPKKWLLYTAIVLIIAPATPPAMAASFSAAVKVAIVVTDSIITPLLLMVTL